MHTDLRSVLLASAIALAMVAIIGALAADRLSREVTDARQETQIWTTYSLHPSLRAHDLKAAVHRGKARLTGSVAQHGQKQLAKEIALGVNGVNEVDNQIVVRAGRIPPRPASARSHASADSVAADSQRIVNEPRAREIDNAVAPADEAGQDISDSWITTPVEPGLVF